MQKNVLLFLLIVFLSSRFEIFADSKEHLVTTTLIKELSIMKSTSQKIKTSKKIRAKYQDLAAHVNGFIEGLIYCIHDNSSCDKLTKDYENVRKAFDLLAPGIRKSPLNNFEHMSMSVDNPLGEHFTKELIEGIKDWMYGTPEEKKAKIEQLTSFKWDENIR